MARLIRIRSWLLLLCAVAISLVIAEVAVRAYEKTRLCHQERPVPEGLYRPDARYGHSLTPGYLGRLDGGCWQTPVGISSEGTRGPEPGAKVPGARRILLVGDSYVFGTGVDEEAALPVRLEKALAASTRSAERSLEVINAGVPGWTTVQPPLLVEEKARRLEIDEVILHIYLGNDIEERMRFEERGSGPAERPEKVEEPSPTSRRSLLSSIHLLGMIRGRVKKLAYMAGARRQPLDIWFGIFEKEMPPRVRRGYELIDSDLAQLSSLCASEGVTLRAVVTPSWLQVLLPTEEIVCSRFVCDPGGIDVRKPNREIGAILERRGIPYIDLTENLVDARAQGRFDLVIGHWDENGTRLAAGWISEWLGSLPSADRAVTLP